MNPEAPPKAGRREWIGLAVIALPCLLYSMDLTVLNLALPSLAAELKPSAAQLLWIVDIYGFLVAGALITMGTLGDRIGRRKLLLIGAATFGVASIAAAFSRSAEMLIATRALLGLSGATLAPSTLSLIRNMFHDPSQRTVAVGVWITSYSAGAAIGPLIGGVLLEQFWWGSVFLVSVPVMVLLLAVGPWLLPEYRDPRAGRIDLASAALSLAAVLLVIYGLKRIATDGVALLPIGTIVAGVALGLAFVRRQRVLEDPFMDLRLFRAPAFTASLAAYAFGTFVAFGIFVFVAQYLQLVQGMSPLRAGVATVPFALAFIAGSQLTPFVVRRVRPHLVMAAGLVVAAVGFGVLTQIDEALGIGVLLTGFVLFALGLAPVLTLSNDLILGTAPPERAGAASALSETGSELGGALGIAILGSAGTAVFRSRMADSIPDGIGAEASEAARETLGGAIAAAERLPAPFDSELIAAARDAFVVGMQVAAASSAIIVTALAILVVARLRSPGAGPTENAGATAPG